MIKTTLLTVSTIALMGAATPALAGAFGDEDYGWAAERFQSSLQERGINAVDVYEAGDNIRADVKLADGTIEFQYFDADTFARINL